jgi:hypothetical protein
MKSAEARSSIEMLRFIQKCVFPIDSLRRIGGTLFFVKIKVPLCRKGAGRRPFRSSIYIQNPMQLVTPRLVRIAVRMAISSWMMYLIVSRFIVL